MWFSRTKWDKSPSKRPSSKARQCLCLQGAIAVKAQGSKGGVAGPGCVRAQGSCFFSDLWEPQRAFEGKSSKNWLL